MAKRVEVKIDLTAKEWHEWYQVMLICILPDVACSAGWKISTHFAGSTHLAVC
jgi:hypothetical protein